MWEEEWSFIDVPRVKEDEHEAGECLTLSEHAVAGCSREKSAVCC